MAIVLAALSLLGLGIFGPGIANGLVSGGPQLGAGAAVGTGLAAGGAVVARRSGRGWPCAEARAPSAAPPPRAAARPLLVARRRLRARHQPASRARPASLGLGGVARAGGGAAAISGARGLGRRAMAESFAMAREPRRSHWRRIDHGHDRREHASRRGSRHMPRPPAWAQRMQRHQTMSHGVTAAAHAVRSGDATAAAASVDLSEGGPLMLVQASLRPLRPHARARDALSEGRAGLGRAHRLRPRPGEELAAMAFGSLILAAGFAGALVWQSARGTIMPWVVQVDKLGQAQAVAPAIADYRPTDPQIAWHLARFIEHVRSIPADPVIVRQNWLRAYDFTTDHGAAALNDYARANDPFTKVGKHQVAVEVSSVIRASPDSFRVAWTERRYENGQLAATERWTAILTIVLHPARRRSAAQEPARHLRQRHQLVEGAGQ